MKRHASLNRCYRLIWSTLLNTWVAVAETARGRGKAASRKRLHRLAAISTTTLASLLLPLVLSPAVAAPVGGEVVSGNASISHTGNTTSIVQATPNATLNWQGFNIAPTEVVNFIQPSAAAIAVNRIMDSNGTQILGQLNANGQVYLINPNGILFGAGSQVNVGGLVASTLDFNDASLNSNSRSFSGNGIGQIINQGNLQASDGGYIALLGNSVSNQGVITAQLGTVALAAGSAVSLNFSGNQLLHLQIEQSTLNNLADNGQLIQADGGRVFMSAGASNSLLASVVNNSGIVQAQTVVERDGQIILMGGMSAGTTNVAGTLDASALHGGNGGFIETSAAKVNISNAANITTAAAAGLTGSWLIDPVDFTVAASGGNITGASLGTLLNSNNVTLQTITGINDASNVYGTSGSNGDIFINDAINWTATTSLTLNAFRNISINQSITASNALGKLALLYGQGAVAAGNAAVYNINAPVNLQSGLNFITTLGSDGVVKPYFVINSLGVETDATGGAATLQGMAKTTNLAKNYALGSNIDAAATSTWNSNTGFTPIGDATTKFSGSFDGLGHTISNLSINRPFDHDLGLFGNASTTASIKNIGLLGGGIYGFYNVGSVAGSNAGNISNSFANTNVYGVDTFVPPWTYNDSYFVGGLVGLNSGTISNSHASGNVSAYSSAGGLVGVNQGASSLITNSYATGNVAASLRYAGGLLGINSGTVSNSYATGSASAGFYVGGLAGINYGSINNNYATGSTNGNFYVGGLAGENRSSISNNFASGTVTGSNSAGGLVGVNSGSVSTSFWDTVTTGKATSAGGTGLTTSQTLTQVNFTSATAANGNVNPNWDFSNTWYMVDGSTRPFLRMEYNTNISNAHQLQLMGMDLSANYTLANNLNLAAELANPSGMWGTASASVLTGISTGFSPIGNSPGNYLSGSFDGLGHTISNLSINRPTTNYVGLFGNIYGNSIISNLGLVGAIVTGSNYVGGLVGSGYGNTLSNSYANGSVSGNRSVGGLVGRSSYNTIANSHANASVNGTDYIGGLVGSIGNSTINNSYANGNVAGSIYTGGLVGLGSYTTINNSYASGSVSGTSDYIGGLVGYSSYGNITNSHATGGVIGVNSTGGLVGFSRNDTISTSFTTATSTVSGNNEVGGLIGSTDSSIISDNHASGLVGGYNYVGGLVGSNYYSDIINSYATGGVSGNDYAGGLVAWNYGATISNSHATGNVSATRYAGGLVGSSWFGIVSNSYANGNVNATADFAGGLVGQNHASIDYSYATGDVVGDIVVGGLVGSNYEGVIRHSYATGNATGLYHVGGLAGWNDLNTSTLGLVSDSYASGTASGSEFIGGLIGYNTGTINNSFWNSSNNPALSSTGSGVSVWLHDNDPSVSGFGTSTGYGATSLSTAQMSQLNSFSSWGAAINNTGVGGAVWRIYEGHTAPLLTSFMTSLTLADAPDVSATYTGLSQSGATTATGGLLGTAATGTNAGFYNGYYSTQQGYNLSGGNLLIAKANASVLANSGSLTYNGSNQSLTGFTASGLVNGDTTTSLTGVSASGSGKDAGNYTVVASGSDTNYNLSFSNGLLTINPADLILSGTRSYDGSTIVAGSTLSANGVFGETFSISGSGDNSNLLNKNVQTNNPLASLNGLSLGASSNGGLASNYNALSTTGSLFSVSKLALTATLSAPSKTYDGTTSATPTFSLLTGLVGSETVLATGVATFNSKDVAWANLVTVNSTSLADGTNGGLATNYSLSSGQTAAASITAKAISTNGISASNKIYDGNAVASLSGIASVSAFGSDDVTIGGTGSGLFDNANVGLGKAVTVSGYSLGGADAGNYNLLQPMGLIANISAIPTSPVLAPSTPSQFDMQAEAANARLSKTNVRAEPLLLSSSITIIRDVDATAPNADKPAISVFSHGVMQSLQQPVMPTATEPTLRIVNNAVMTTNPLLKVSVQQHE